MIPIFEQGRGIGIGHSIDSFFQRFTEICEKSKSENQKKTFAFILYDFNDTTIKRILKDKGVFTKLDRLTGNSLDVFYLNSNDVEIFNNFNKIISHSFNFKENLQLPCMVFFDFFYNEIENVTIVALEQNNVLLGFNEITNVLKNQIIGGNRIENQFSLPKGLVFIYKLCEKIGISILTDNIKRFFIS